MEFISNHFLSWKAPSFCSLRHRVRPAAFETERWALPSQFLQQKDPQEHKGSHTDWDDLIVHSLHSHTPVFSAGFEGEGKGRRLSGAEVFLNLSARKKIFYMCFEGEKNEKNCTDLLRAERQCLKANCIVIHLSCEEATQVMLEKQPCARAKMLAVLLGQETQGFLPLRSLRCHFNSLLAEFSVSLEKFWNPKHRNCLPGLASVSACWELLLQKEGARSTPAANSQALLPQRSYANLLKHESLSI